jgi:epoxide hydrolase-like predicted phosphatase
MKGIKNIIFDLGGVILNIDYKRPQEEFKKLGIKDVETLYSKQNQVELFDLLETGKISEKEFVQKIKESSDLEIADSEIITAWNSILLEFPLRRLQILQQLQLHYNIYLLSNTNEIHEKAFNEMLKIQCGYPSLALFFDRVYLSHRVGLRKPDPNIFELVINENNLKIEETLFIDDSLQHIESASKLGLKTIHLKDNMTMENDIFRAK